LNFFFSHKEWSDEPLNIFFIIDAIKKYEPKVLAGVELFVTCTNPSFPEASPTPLTAFAVLVDVLTLIG
jgi:hypothetical protein